jgi:hypothetical protein
MDSKIERQFDRVWEAIGGPDLEREYRFDPGRRWQFDRAWVERKVAFEIDGGAWKVGKDGQRGGRHNRPLGFRNDCEKANAAAALGWRVCHLTSDMVSMAYVEALLVALRDGGRIDFRFARKGGRARRFKLTPKGRLLICNSFRRSGGAPSSSSP